ncbi:phosphatidate cytidylyltransferase [Sphaerothrix gracilis]|uniref:diacylglycerol/polyprenol kinase family protein n=1 Tax=Sphaerothrix gracilis TaxID=3151835 RepID=UPI0031FBA885
MAEVHNALVTGVAFVLALLWLKLINSLADRGLISPTLSRKIIHIGTGPLFVLGWPFFTASDGARFWAVLIPLGLTLRFFAIGLGWLTDESAVKAMTRHHDPQELLRGPLYYGIAFIVCTLLFWRTSPTGILALMTMCAGDGLADVVGRRWGKHKLPFGSEKSWIGSAAMFVGSWSLGWAMVALFETLGYFDLSLATLPTGGIIGAIALIATLVEALPFRDIDNLTLTATAAALAQWWLG